ncbi:MAG TPA: sodium:solute symporter family protein [Clostridiales bacterium]|nr:sodium:solute symporter family protein [Clostridiales bacterium]
MDKMTIIWTTIFAYIAIMVAIGILSSKKSNNISDFTVGDKKAGAWMSAFSYGTAYFSAVMFIGYAGGTGWGFGLWGIAAGIGNAVFGAFFAWLVLARRTREYTRTNNIKSMPQLFGARFNSQSMKLFSVIVIFIFLLPYSASVYKGLTSVCSVLLQVDEQVCMIVIAVIAAILVITGGYMATLKADFAQGIIMLVGVIALIFSIVRAEQVGGFSEGIKAIAEKTNDLHLTTSNHIALWSIVLMTSFGTWGLPQMVHKYYGIKDDKQVKRGTIISTFFALIVAGGGYFIGSFARLFYNDLSAMPAKNPTDYLVPNMLAEAGISNVLVGVVLVLLIAASVSTLAAITITASSTLTMDLIQPRFIKNKEKNIAPLTKVICGLFIILSYIIANSNTPILDMMSYSWGILSGSFLAPYMISLYSKKISKNAAWFGMIGGFVTALPPLVAKLFKSEFALGSFGPLHKMGPQFACAAMIVSIILVLVITQISPAKQEQVAKA